MNVIAERPAPEAVAAWESGTFPCIFVSAINYEERSLAFLRIVVEQLRQSSVERAQFVLLTFPGGHLTSLLEAFRRENYQRAKDLTAARKYRKDFCEFPDYPPSPEALLTALERNIRAISAGEPIALFVDISCLPKLVMWRLFGVILDSMREHRIPVASLTVVYTWAGRYPSLTGAVGEPRCYFAGNSVRDYVHGQHGSVADTVLLVFPSHQGFEGQAVYESLRGSGRIHPYVFFMVNRQDPFRSLRVLRANQGLLDRHSLERDTAIHYYFTLSDGFQQLESAIESETGTGGKCFLVAPFGPKPLSLAAFLKVYELKRRQVQADLLSLSSHQYVSIYSYGSLETSALELPVE